MRNMLVVAALLAALAGLFLFFNRNGGPADAVAGVADAYIECSAYYQHTADALAADDDPESVEQYRERATLALDAGAAISGQPALELIKKRNGMVAAFSADHSDLGDLASRYDERCLPLLDQ